MLPLLIFLALLVGICFLPKAPRLLATRLAIYLSIPLLAWVQIYVANRPMSAPEPGPWFLYGRDTLGHDAVVQAWIQQQVARDPYTIPLWIAEIQGGIPTLGSFLWTPLAPQAWPFLFLPFPYAQTVAWCLCLMIAGFGGLLLGRATGLRLFPALFVGVAWMLSGHVVTLIHAGHFQKVMSLSWLPWMLAGAVLAARFTRRRIVLRGVALGALGLALMLLCGHPQIAWLGMVGSVALGGWHLLWRRSGRLAGALAVAALLAAGLAAASPQLLPGVEMSALSNRAQGVSFEEAVETSYPPGELAEFIIPRFKGSSVFGDTYTGQWGERIVSDHAGLVFVLLGILALAMGRLSRTPPWFLLGIFFLVVGLGRYTPLYGFLYNYTPGFGSFRSPGTFFAAPALAIAVLAGHGAHVGLRLLASLRWWRHPVAVGVLSLGVVSLLMANLHFLFVFPWNKYQTEFLAPTELDVWLSEGNRPHDTHDAASDLSLRPILFGRRSLRGYHPISYATKLEDDARHGYNSSEWFAANGVRLVVAPYTPDAPGEHFPQLGRTVVPFVDSLGLVSGPTLIAAEWTKRTPNHRLLAVRSEGGQIRVRETATTGMEIRLNGELQPMPTGPVLETRIDVPAGEVTLEWSYRPFSWRAGLFLGALGAFVIAFCLAYSKRAVPTRTIVEPSSIATS